MEEEHDNPFDDSNIMAPPEQPREATGDVEQSVEQDAGQSAQASQLEPPRVGIHRSTTFPSRLRVDLSPGRQGENDPPEPEPTRTRHRGTTLSSIRQSVDKADRLGSIHEDRPMNSEKQADNAAPSVKSPSIHGASGLRDRSASVASRRRQRAGTFNRAPTIFRRPTIVATGVSSAFGGSAGEEVPGGFTLAGLDSTQAAQNQPYVDPAYAALNPAYVVPTNSRPVWGLAKPLPRVLRPGMVPTPSELDVRPDNGSIHDNASLHDIDDLERGQPSLRRAGTFQATQSLRDQREIRMLRRAGTLPASETGRLSVDEPPAGRVVTGGEPFPNLALPTPIPEGQEDDDGGDYFGQTQSHAYSYVPSATRHATARVGDGHSETTDVEHDDEWPTFAPYDGKMGQPEEEIHNHHTHWSIIRTRYREPLAEFLAALVQLTIGFCADLSITVSNNPNNFSASYAWGFASMTGIYIAGGISGAHLNPAVSIMLWIYRGFPLRKVPSYIIAQLLAAFIAGLISYGLYRNAIIEYGAGLSLGAGGTANAFITSRRVSTVDPATAFFNEFVATAFLAVVVLALGDDSNAPPGAGMSALVLGLVITVLCMAFGYNTGAALNPSRDLGPRLALWAVGYGSELWNDSYWVYGPWCGTILGAIIGGGFYDIAIFVGGESPINYPRKRIWRAGHKFKKRMHKRIKREQIPDGLR